VLEALAGKGGASKSREVASSCAMNGTAASNLLTALQEKGYVGKSRPLHVRNYSEKKKAIA
jgi:DNA-binding IclR family transcriptional regulator